MFTKKYILLFCIILGEQHTSSTIQTSTSVTPEPIISVEPQNACPVVNDPAKSPTSPSLLTKNDHNQLTGVQSIVIDPQPSTSGLHTTLDETRIDFSSDDSVADPTYAIPDQAGSLSSPDPPSESEELPQLLQHPSSHSRKRKRENKLKRNLGLPYVTASGKNIQERKMQDLPDCRNKCRNKISDDQRALIHKEFWDLGSYDLRAAFVSSLITIQEKQTERRRVADPERQKFRQCTYKYHLNVNSEKVTVCQGCFLKTLSITDNFVKLIGLKKRSTSSGIIQPDTRGKKTPSNKH